jgi:uncharacterized protein (TIGR03435 family)
MYSIDQGGQPLPIGVITLQGSTVKMTVPGIGGTYEGNLSGDGNSIKGTWSQGPMPLPLNLTRTTAEAAWAIPEPRVPLKPMAVDANPVFEVAVIKPSRPDATDHGVRVNGRQFYTINTTVSDLMTFAYRLHSHQIAGGPAWIESEKYDLLAEPDGDGQPNDRQWRIMVEKLLAQRFKLAFHYNKKELSVYAITVGKTGPKLTKSTGDPNGLYGAFFRGRGNMVCSNANMGDFAANLQSRLDRPVLDQTGISGRYDFTLKWTPDDSQFVGQSLPSPQPTDDGTTPPNLFTAIQQQLGLKIEAKKAPADVLVIDHVERPSPN